MFLLNVPDVNDYNEQKRKTKKKAGDTIK